jgi:fructose-1,6-bisphosphatase I
VFGIFESNEDTGEEGVDDVVVGGGDGSYTGSKRDDSMVQAVLQPAKNLRAAGYCLYSSATIFIFSLGDGTHGFTLDPRVGEFVMTHPNIRIPTRGNVYSCNEANSVGWSDDVSTFVRALKTGKGETGEKYAVSLVQYHVLLKWHTSKYLTTLYSS